MRELQGGAAGGRRDANPPAAVLALVSLRLWFLTEHERSCPSCRAVLEVDDDDAEELAPPRPSAYEEFLRLRESGVLAAMIRQHQEQEQERASARSALFEPRAGGQGGVIASML